MNFLRRAVAGLAAIGALASPAAAKAEEAPADSTDLRPTSRVMLPVLAYTPDTDLMFGGTVLRFFYLEDDGPDVRPSSLVPALIRTTRSQTLAFLGLELNWDRGRRQASASLGYIRFPDQFHGLGRESRRQDEEDYTPETISAALGGEQRIYRDLRLGLGWRQTNYRTLEFLAGGLLDTGGLIDAGVTTLAQPELTVAWDSRDNTWAPRRGLWLKGLVRFSPTLLGSDREFTGHVVDLRGYRPVGERATLAAQLTATWLTGDAPFFALPRLGGQDGLRGYPGGRFTDAARVIGRVEWRSGPRWGRVGVAAFAGMGDIAPRLADTTLAGGLYTVGGGLRVLLNKQERVSLRMDFGAGKDHSGFFLTLGEAF